MECYAILAWRCQDRNPCDFTIALCSTAKYSMASPGFTDAPFRRRSWAMFVVQIGTLTGAGNHVKAIFRSSDFSYNIRGQFLDFILSSPHLSPSHHHVNSHSVAPSAICSLWCVSSLHPLVMTAPSTCETGIHPSVPCPWWADSRSQPPAGHIVMVAKSGRIYPLKLVSTSANWWLHWIGLSPEVTGQGGTGHWVLQRVSAYLNFHSWLQ